MARASRRRGARRGEGAELELGPPALRSAGGERRLPMPPVPPASRGDANDPRVPAGGTPGQPAPRGAEEKVSAEGRREGGRRGAPRREGAGRDLGPAAPRGAANETAPGSISPSTRAAGAVARDGRESGDTLTPGGLDKERKRGEPRRERGAARQTREGTPGKLRRAIRAPPPGPESERPEPPQGEGGGTPRADRRTHAGPGKGVPGSLRRDEPSTHSRGQGASNRGPPGGGPKRAGRTGTPKRPARTARGAP